MGWWNGKWNGMVEWKMEWNSEYAQLQLTRVTSSYCVELPSVSLGVLSSYCRGFMNMLALS